MQTLQQMAPQAHKHTKLQKPFDLVNYTPLPQTYPHLHPTPNSLFLFTNTSSEAPGLSHLSHHEPTDLVQK